MVRDKVTAKLPLRRYSILAVLDDALYDIFAAGHRPEGIYMPQRMIGGVAEAFAEASGRDRARVLCLWRGVPIYYPRQTEHPHIEYQVPGDLRTHSVPRLGHLRIEVIGTSAVCRGCRNLTADGSCRVQWPGVSTDGWSCQTAEHDGAAPMLRDLTPFGGGPHIRGDACDD